MKHVQTFLHYLDSKTKLKLFSTFLLFYQQISIQGHSHKFCYFQKLFCTNIDEDTIQKQTLQISKGDTKFVFLVLLRFFVQNLLCLEQVEWEIIYIEYRFFISIKNKICIFILLLKFNSTQTIVFYIQVFISLLPWYLTVV